MTHAYHLAPIHTRQTWAKRPYLIHSDREMPSGGRDVHPGRKAECDLCVGWRRQVKRLAKRRKA